MFIVSLMVVVALKTSYVWRSILCARKTVDDGVRWQVQNGNKIRVWHDNWLPEQSDFKILFHQQSLEPGTLVESWLMKILSSGRETWSWEISPLMKPSNFSIFQSRLLEDKIICHWQKDGDYLVRSAHHLLYNENSKKIPKIYLAPQIQTNKIWGVFGKRCVNQGPNLYMEAC